MEILEIEKYIFQSFKWRQIWIEKPYLNVFTAGNVFSLSNSLKDLMVKYFVSEIAFQFIKFIFQPDNNNKFKN